MDPVRVVIVWPGTDGVAAGNFGVPQLCTMATYARRETGAEITIIDLACERAYGPFDLRRLAFDDHGNRYDVVGFSCYSSFDYLKVHTIAESVRRVVPDAVFVSGGYHTSSRPHDFVYDGSPFDVAVIGEGERPLVEVIRSVQGGAPLRQVILGPSSIEDLDSLPVTDWSFLARYRSVAHQVATQAEVYLSRGCPYDCAFCMERAKRDVSWRAYSVDRALAEIESLDRFVGLSGMSVYIADALFGMKKRWRREFLDRFAARRPSALAYWLLIRVDMVEEEDLELFARANVGLGFGLESGDPAQLARIRKAGKLESYLERMVEISAFARHKNVPWGANVIFGHPGETEASLRTSAQYLRKLFCNPRGTSGFLSVDPFRLYPGSPIDDERSDWEARYGTRFYRPQWWKDGDQEFLSEWVDPSADLGYRRCKSLVSELVNPILAEIPKHFCYQGFARGYYQRAVDEQIRQTSTQTRLHFIDRYYAWNRYLGLQDKAIQERRQDRELGEVCAIARKDELAAAQRTALLSLGGETDARGSRSSALDAVAVIARERFVPPDQILSSTRDEAIPLDSTGQASVSAMHAYLVIFELACVREGERVLDLGAGSGYGTALLAQMVGSDGHVRSVEIDPALVKIAQQELAEISHVEFLVGDALLPHNWDLGPYDAAVVGFAVTDLASLRPLSRAAATVVAPVVFGPGDQRLVRLRRGPDGGVVEEIFARVHYVSQRSSVDVQALVPLQLQTSMQQDRARSARSLPVVR